MILKVIFLMILVEAFLGNGDDDNRQKEHIFRKF